MRDLTINVEGMHCASCGLLIDDSLLDLNGVIASTTDTRAGVCSVRAEDDVTDQSILETIAGAGYTGTIA